MDERSSCAAEPAAAAADHPSALLDGGGWALTLEHTTQEVVMQSFPSAAAVLYAKDISKVSDFYAKTAGLQVTHEERGHIVLESDAFQLVVVAAPRKIAASIHITQPPQRRENTAVKLVFPVASLATARQAAQSHGGQLSEPGREWLFQGSRVCDGQDPEGNVVQFRERAL